MKPSNYRQSYRHLLNNQYIRRHTHHTIIFPPPFRHAPLASFFAMRGRHLPCSHTIVIAADAGTPHCPLYPSLRRHLLPCRRRAAMPILRAVIILLFLPYYGYHAAE